MMLIMFSLVTAFFALYTISPFFEKAFRARALPVGAPDRENLGYRKEEIFAALSDLEYDFKMKKMTESDYSQLKEKLTLEAIQVMKKLDQSEGKTGKVHLAERKSKAHDAGS